MLIRLLPFFICVPTYFFLSLRQAPQMGRRAAPESVVVPEVTVDTTNGDVPAEPRAPLTSAQRLAVSASAAETSADPFGADAKFFTEMRVLNRDVSNNPLQVILPLHLRFF